MSTNNMKGGHSLAGCNAIVTGGSGGIGTAICMELAKRGANVVLTYHSNKEHAQRLADTLVSEFNVKAWCVPVNCEDTFFASDMFIKQITTFLDKIDIIVNNAGIDDLHYMKDLKLAHMERVMKINVYFPVCLVKDATPFFGPHPRIVNVSSISARLGGPTSLAYTMSKSALEGVTKVMAQELGHQYNATVNCVNPGPVNTKMWTNSDPAIISSFGKIMADTPAGNRIGEPDDIAQIVAFLCEEGSRWVTGSTVCANGGMIMN